MTTKTLLLTLALAVLAQPAGAGVFKDGFESGDTGAWTPASCRAVAVEPAALVEHLEPCGGELAAFLALPSGAVLETIEVRAQDCLPHLVLGFDTGDAQPVGTQHLDYFLSTFAPRCGEELQIALGVVGTPVTLIQNGNEDAVVFVFGCLESG